MAKRPNKPPKGKRKDLCLVSQEKKRKETRKDNSDQDLRHNKKIKTLKTGNQRVPRRSNRKKGYP
jgi:hypothetical protein